MSQSLQKAQAIYVVAAVVVISFGYFLRAKRWQVLLEPITETSLKELFATTTVGFASVFFVGRAGEIVRPMWLPMRDKRVRPSAALVTLGIERIFDLAAIVCFFSINLLWFNPPSGREKEFAYVKLVGYLMLAGVALGFVLLYVYKKISRTAIIWVERVIDRRFVPGKIKRIIVSLLRQLAKALEILHDWREITSIIFWTIILWLCVALPTWLVLVAFDLPLNFSDALFVMGWAAMGSIVPTPGGAAGAFHAATAGGLVFLNVAREQAVAVSFVLHLVYFAPAVFFGLYYFLRGDISVARLRNLLFSEAVAEKFEDDRSKEEITGAG